MRTNHVVVLSLLLASQALLGQTYTISTFAGGGVPNNIPGTAASIFPYGVALDPAGNLFAALRNQCIVVRLDAVTGILTTVAGNGACAYGGDGGQAIGAELNDPSGVAIDTAGNLYIADYNNDRIRKVANGMITTVAGGVLHPRRRRPSDQRRAWRPLCRGSRFPREPLHRGGQQLPHPRSRQRRDHHRGRQRHLRVQR